MLAAEFGTQLKNGLDIMEKQYLDTLKNILESGVDTDDRTGVGSRSIFGVQMRHDLNQGFPALTTKKLAWRAVVGELLWFIEGSSDIDRLSELTHGVTGKQTIWHANALDPNWVRNADFDGDAGRIYGVQWRDWRGSYNNKIDQLHLLIKDIQYNPHSRRHILTAWNPDDLGQMCLPPCHVLSQFYVRNGKLSCQMYQRSADWFLGIPFNIASYSLLTHMIAQVCGLGVGEFVHVIGDAHVYHNHMDQVKEQLTRTPLPLPTVWLNPDIKDINHFTPNDIKLIDYQCHPAIAAPMAV
jgi:thymidylate synthase